MTPLTRFQPHREQLPRRRCSDCRALLSTGNETETCWQCDPSWDAVPDLENPYMGKLMRNAIGQAIDEILAPEVYA